MKDGTYTASCEHLSMKLERCLVISKNCISRKRDSHTIKQYSKRSL